MALSTKTIVSKIKSVKNIRKITKAMELVAASKMKKAVERALNSREYAEAFLNLLVFLSKDIYNKHPLLEEGKGDRDLILVIASNKGLCGGFNTAVSKKVVDNIKTNLDIEKTDFVTIGKNGERIAKRINKNIVASFLDFSEHVHIDDIYGLAKLIINEFISGKYKGVYICATDYVSSISYKPYFHAVLPISRDVVKNAIEKTGPHRKSQDLIFENMSVYEFEPNEEEILGVVLSRLVEVQIYQSLLDSFASEHSARMFAMKNASDNAKEFLSDLELSYNKARQAAVTDQISEIAAGAEALRV
jgi:F-type H+-transporting ATPase subunit gamma